MSTIYSLIESKALIYVVIGLLPLLVCFWVVGYWRE
jgi:hypothetical protein